MRIALILLALAALLFSACAETSSSRYRRSNSVIDLANTCATCGAAINDSYFANTAFSAMGPGNY
jgi:hypothetical protein